MKKHMEEEKEEGRFGGMHKGKKHKRPMKGKGKAKRGKGREM